MKKYIVTFGVAALPFLYMSSAANKVAAQTKGKSIVVPKGKTYVILDKNGKVTATYKAGKVVPMGETCYPAPCPKDKRADRPCFKCPEM
jgi:hypothetical protein